SDIRAFLPPHLHSAIVSISRNHIFTTWTEADYFAVARSMCLPGFWRKFSFRHRPAVGPEPELGDLVQNPGAQSTPSQTSEERAQNVKHDKQAEPPISIRDLWNVAYQKLRDENSALVSDFEKRVIGDISVGLASVPGSNVNRREMMDGVLKQKMDEINKNTWKLRFGTTEVLVKEMVQPVLTIIDRTNEYINDALSSNPSASLAWSGVSLLLPLLLNPSKQASSLMKALEYVSNLLIQSRMWESLYVRKYESSEETLRESLRASTHRDYMNSMSILYQKILKLQLSAYCFYSKNEAFRYGLDMLKWHDWDVELEEIRRQEDAFLNVHKLWRDKAYDEECMAMEQRHRENTIQWDAIGLDLSELRRVVQDVSNREQNKELFHWLCDIDPSQNYNTALDHNTDGTGNWLVENGQFTAWKEEPGSFLWLHGKAGSGKSILTSTVIRHLGNEHRQDPMTALAYFYFSFSDLKKQTLDGMLSSLILQLCARRPIIPPAVENLGTFKDRGQRPDNKTLTEAFIESLQGFSSVYIVLDALDECPVSNNVRKGVLDTIRRIVSANIPNLHFLCTSRKERDIDLQFAQILSQPYRYSIDLTFSTMALEKDIKSHIDTTLGSIEFDSWPRPVKDEVRDALVQKADGMFQYVSLQLNALKDISSASQIRQALLDLPIGLDAAYERILQNIDARFRGQVANALKWLALSQETLTLENLVEIFVLRPGCTPVYRKEDKLFEPRDVLKYLSGLVVDQGPKFSGGFDPQDINIRLAHFSVKEYLMSDRITQGPSACFSFVETSGHLHIAELCIARHLQECTEFHPLAGYTLLREELSFYALYNWPRHLEMVPRHMWPPAVVDLARVALRMRSPSLFGMISAARSRHIKSQELESMPHAFTALSGFVQLTDLLLQNHRYQTQEDTDGCLQAAAYGASSDLVRRMLDQGANPNAFGPLADSALHAAAATRDVETLELLMERGADIHASRGNQGTPLQVASHHGRVNQAKILIQRGSDVNFATYEGGSVLTSAVFSGEWNTVHCLLDSGASINGSGGKFGSALHAAASTASVRFLDGWYFESLFQRGADVNAYCPVLGSPLHVAVGSKSENYEVAKLLIDHRAKVNVRGGKYETVLQAACASDGGSAKLARLLLSNGADINARGGYYETALQAACAHRDATELVQMLLENGADPNVQGGFYGNALQAACHHSAWDVVQLLLDRGLDVNTPGGEYGNALQAALAREGPQVRMFMDLKTHIVRLLLSRGADVNQKGGRYGTALQAAAFYADRDEEDLKKETHMVRFLLGHGAEVNAEGGEYGTALQAACASGKFLVVRLLVENGADIYLRGGLYGSAWHAAAAVLWREPLEAFDAHHILNLLRQHGIDVDDTQEGQHASALQAALEVKVDLWWTTGKELTWPRTNRIEYLLAKGANPNIGAGQYGFPLQSACANDSKDKPAELFLASCSDIDVNAQGGLFGTALQAAAYTTLPSTVERLLERGANVNLRGGRYRSALNAAVVKGYWDNVEVLMKAGAKPDCQLMEEVDESWLGQVLEWDGRGAVERYRKFWEVESSGSPRG
ncbi:ankyrin repeat-containing domain protein, partial [Echria macrotheca]